MSWIRPNSTVERRFVSPKWLSKLLGLASLVALLAASCGAPHSLITMQTDGSDQSVGSPRLLHPAPHYFTDGSRSIYLTGFHTWNTVQDWGASEPPPKMNYSNFLASLRSHHCNFTRLFTWEQVSGMAWTGEKVWFSPTVYERTGPGAALDGGLKFDLHRLNPAYFARLRERVAEADRDGVYVSVMLFNGWSVSPKREGVAYNLQRTGLGNPWLGHPFNPQNNINSVNGDPDHSNEGLSVHTLRSPVITALQQNYLRHVIDTLNQFDNVLWEICNECDPGSEAWQYHMIRFIKDYEAQEPKQHPVGMTALYPGGTNRALLESPADWISPSDTAGEPFKNDPPVNLTSKVILTDTDHLWGIGGNPSWVWRSICRGLNPIYMDPYDASLIGIYPMYWHVKPVATPRERSIQSNSERIRANLGYARILADRIDLASASPHDELVSHGYCLAAPGKAYLVYLPAEAYGWRSIVSGILRGHVGESVTLDLSGEAARTSHFTIEWFNPASGQVYRTGSVEGGYQKELRAPFRGDAVLFATLQHVPSAFGVSR